MQRDLLLRREMIDAVEQAQSLVAGRTASEIDGDRLRRDALLWNFTVLGKAATLVSDATKARFPTIPWRNPARLHDRIVHGYWSVDVGVLHTTALDQLGDFVRQLVDRVARGPRSGGWTGRLVVIRRNGRVRHGGSDACALTTHRAPGTGAFRRPSRTCSAIRPLSPASPE